MEFHSKKWNLSQSMKKSEISLFIVRFILKILESKIVFKLIENCLSLMIFLCIEINT